MRFLLEGSDGDARAGRLVFPRAEVPTPVFMPVGTYGSVKGVTPEQLRQLGVPMVLGNALHLALRPGVDVVATHGGLHAFAGYSCPILTDSGGYQVFSLAQLREINDQGVRFRSPVDGSLVDWSPEIALRAQREIGAEVIMVLDDCPAYPVSRQRAEQALYRSLDWARRSKCTLEEYGRPEGPEEEPALFGIVQGSVFPQLRRLHIRELRELGFPGYAIGGLSVGEPRAAVLRVLDDLLPHMPRSAPRYLMGVGTPEEIVAAVSRGVDMFDCVLPTRNARNGQLFTSAGLLRIRNAQHRNSTAPLDPRCTCSVCRQVSRGYLHHLQRCGEMLGGIFATLHNLHYYQQLMRDLRLAILEGRLEAFRQHFLSENKEKAGI